MSDDGSTLVLFRPLPADLRLSAEEKRTVRAFTRTLSERVAGQRPFTCLITNDAELQTLNQRFLGHDYPTDVLSFPSRNGSRELGEIALSVERAEAQARVLGHDRADEIRILMLHGVLHLTGLDHERDRGEMAAAERKWRTEFALPLTLIARAARKRTGHGSAPPSRKKHMQPSAGASQPVPVVRAEQVRS